MIPAHQPSALRRFLVWSAILLVLAIGAGVAWRFRSEIKRPVAEWRAQGLARESAALGAAGEWAAAERRALAAHQMAPLAYGPREALFRATRNTGSPYLGPAALAVSSHPDAPDPIRIEALDAVIQAGQPQIFLHLYRTLPEAVREQDETVLRVIDFFLLTRQTAQVRALIEARQARGMVDRRFTAKLVSALLQSPGTPAGSGGSEGPDPMRDAAEAHRLVTELATDRDDLFRAALGEVASLPLPRLRPDLLPADAADWLEARENATVEDRLLATRLRLAADPEPAREARVQAAMAQFRETAPETLAAWLFSLDRPDAVLEVIDEARGRQNRELYILRLRALERADRDGKGAEAMLAWLEDPHPEVDRADVLVTQAACHFRLGKKTEALAAWEEVLGLAEVDPSHHPAAKLYLLALSQGQLDLAARLLLQAARRPGPPAALPPSGALTPVMAHLQRSGRMEDLRTLTEAMLRREEDNPVLRNNFAYLCFLFGQNVAEALAISEELVARDPDALSFRTTLALGRLTAGQTTAALDALSAPGLDWNLAGPADHAIRAAALERSGRTAEAAEARRQFDPSALTDEERRILAGNP